MINACVGNRILTNKKEAIQIKIWHSHPVARAKHSLMTKNKTIDKAQLGSYCFAHNVILFLNTSKSHDETDEIDLLPVM